MNAEMMLALIEEGDRAYQDGLGIDECPYAKASDHWQYWCDGWREACDADAPIREREERDRQLDDPRRGQAKDLNR